MHRLARSEAEVKAIEDRFTVTNTFSLLLEDLEEGVGQIGQREAAVAAVRS